jgi:Spy/CpxP family protein refolding chaperone
MNMTSKRKVLAAMIVAGGTLLAAAGFSIAVAADDSAPGTAASAPVGHHHWGPGRLYSKLGLTAEQQASIKAVWTAAKPQMQSLHEQMKANHQKLRQTKPDDPNYGNVVAEVAQSEATLASQRTSQMAEIRAQMYAVLTPAQKTQLATLEAQWAANPHRGGPHGPSANAAPAAQ